jgi:hypothetical protein
MPVAMHPELVGTALHSQLSEPAQSELVVGLQSIPAPGSSHRVSTLGAPASPVAPASALPLAPAEPALSLAPATALAPA